MKQRNTIATLVMTGVITIFSATSVSAMEGGFAGVTAEIGKVLDDVTYSTDPDGSAGITSTLQRIAWEKTLEGNVNYIKEKEAEEERLKEEERKAEEERQRVEALGGYKTYDSPGGEFKSFMDWRCITSRSSRQWKLQHTYAYTDQNGIREIEGRLCVALGSYFGAAIGQYVDLVMESGEVIPCIMADQKADKDTDPTNRWHSIDGSVGEFVVDKSMLTQEVLSRGDVSYAYWPLKGRIQYIRVYGYTLIP